MDNKSMVSQALGSFRKEHVYAGLIFFMLASTALQVSAKNENLPTMREKKEVQQSKITGTVKTESGEPLPGATVQVKGTTTGTVTDVDGHFSLPTNLANVTLVVSFVGYQSIEIAATTQSPASVVLKELTTGLDEVVVVGYGVQKKKLSTGATVNVKSEDMEKDHAVRIESALQGKAPGVSIVKQSSQPGSDFNITIRGVSSANGSTPLVIIDGVPGSLSNLNTEDIESIDILKDAASAAIYGSRAGDGVILVTTKKGKAGDMQISYDGYFGISNPYRKVGVLNAKEYAIVMNESNINSGYSPLFSQDQINSLGKGTDWQDEAFKKNALSQNHHIALTGGG